MVLQCGMLIRSDVEPVEGARRAGISGSKVDVHVTAPLTAPTEESGEFFTPHTL